MTPQEAVPRLLAVPYVLGQGDWTGADCWGLVELWYREVLSLPLSERSGRHSARQSIDAWASAPTGWVPIASPEDHCLVLMRSGRLNAGHVGIAYQNRVLHSAKSHGCVYQPLSDRLIRASTTGYLRKL